MLLIRAPDSKFFKAYHQYKSNLCLLKDTPPASAETCRVYTDPAAPDVPVPKTEAKKQKLSFNWKDPLDLESKLTDEEKLVRDTAYSYCQEKLLPRVTMANREEVYKNIFLLYTLSPKAIFRGTF